MADPIAFNFHIRFINIMEMIQNQRRRRLEYRHIRDMSNPFEMTDEMFIKLFRLNKEAVNNLIEELAEFVNEPQRINKVPFFLQIFICLNFFGHGGYQTTVGQDLNLAVSQPVVSRIIRNISNIITIYLLPRYVKFPTTNEELRQVKERFLETLNFPNVVGCVDGTQIAITSPNIDDPVYPAVAYLNRKGYHSINVQAIFDADMRLLNVNARYPGATHDSAIWQVSTIHHHLKRKYQEGQRETWLLGDSGYPLQPWLMTPINDAPPNTPEALYTQRHIHARNVGERGNGLWKARFRCLKKDRVLHYKHEIAGRIIYSCAVLHNICKIYNIPNPENLDDGEEENEEGDNAGHQNIDVLEEGRLVRRRLVEWFQNN